jgi:hypothetical protein
MIVASILSAYDERVENPALKNLLSEARSAYLARTGKSSWYEFS